EDERKLWNNAEEFVNISAVEGSLRQEHGLESRQYHAGDWLKTQGPLMRSKLDKLLINKVAAEKFKEQRDALLEIYKTVLGESSDDKRLVILTSPETRKLIHDLEQALATESSGSKTEESVSDKPEIGEDVGEKVPVVSGGDESAKKELI